MRAFDQLSDLFFSFVLCFLRPLWLGEICMLLFDVCRRVYVFLSLYPAIVSFCISVIQLILSEKSYSISVSISRYISYDKIDIFERQ
jgi:hypothetical protein